MGKLEIMFRPPLDKRRGGFLLVDVLLAAAIVFSGLAVVVNIMPKLMDTSEKRWALTAMTNYALAEQQFMMTQDYDDIGATGSGNFYSTPIALFPATVPGIQSYTWRYTSTEVIPNVMKQVNLVVENPTKELVSDTFTFYITDLTDSSP